MSPASSLFHVLKDQIRSVKYSIRAEAHMPGSLVPRALQSPEVRRLTSLGSVVSVPAFRLVDGIVVRVETIAMGLLGGTPRGDRVAVESIDAYLADGFDFTDKLFSLLKRIVDGKGRPDAFVSEQALDAAWAAVSREPSAAADPVMASAALAEILARTSPVRCVGHAPGEPDTNFARSPSLYCGMVAGLMIAVASARPPAAEDGPALLESADSAVNARFDRFRRARGAEVPAAAIAAEYRKLLPFLP